MGLEWVDDTSCVLVFDNADTARRALRRLQKSADQPPDDQGFTTAKPVPMSMWPLEDRLTKLLGKEEGMRGEIRIRWARATDVKQKGARQTSSFYKKHGDQAGREIYRDGRAIASSIDTGSPPPRRPTRRAPNSKADLDAELDSFLSGDRDRDRSRSPPRNGRGRGRGRGREGGRTAKSAAELDDELDRFLQDR